MLVNGTDILEPLGICYESLDGDGRIVPANERFWAMADSPMPSGPVSLDEGFAELVGLERELDALMHEGSGQVRLSGFRRGERYLNLTILPGVAVLQDATGEMLAKLTVVQSKNEMAILDEALHSKNAELLEAYGRLDELMNTIRTHNHDLELEVRKRTSELLRSRLSVITTLARVAEFRDTDTGRHTFRIGQASVMIGRELGLPEDRCEQLYYASLLHDIGKIGIPDSILLKPGRLDESETRVMQGHTRIGAEILDRKDHSLFDTAKRVALYHHERWDGSGYPEGLAGEAIPLVGRICAVADVFDALLSKRPYKEPWPLDEALGEIAARGGTQFDPTIVAAFMRVADAIASLHDDDETGELLPPELD
ncbi:MAG TPA: HD domain-containing protein [Spirochaetia bacterium]|nr:HD domain-containing protein [Spirochaetales bacterium]HPE89001.1 HD domain-containing protein [Spirochaetales bacterium]HPG85897.1 HD domain-containing protein [Spirochaetales bacterium]HPM73463.1 HD domain-containing protein [Spirochaetales bacterium]HRW23132.1 HD domain-containing protein [Spirochaetia bacterium]